MGQVRAGYSVPCPVWFWVLVVTLIAKFFSWYIKSEFPMFQLVSVAFCPFPEQRLCSLLPLESLGTAGELLLLPGGSPCPQCLTCRCLQTVWIPSRCRCAHVCVSTSTVSQRFPHHRPWGTALVTNCSSVGPGTAAHSPQCGAWQSGQRSL